MKRRIRILVIGVGGIGSFVAPMLAKMGSDYLEDERQRDLLHAKFDIQIWDKDVVEDTNLRNQNYAISDMEKIKVEALWDRVYGETKLKMDAKNEWFVNDLSYKPDIIVTGLDSMEIRSCIWAGIKQEVIHSEKPIYLVDGRISKFDYSVFALRSDDAKSIKEYEEHLYHTQEAEQEVCTAKAIMFHAYTVAGVIGSMVYKIIEDTNDIPCSVHGNTLELRQARSIKKFKGMNYGN